MPPATRNHTQVSTTDAPVPRRWEIARVVLAGTYLLGGLVHFVLITLSPEVYESFADMALIEPVTAAWRRWVVPNLTVLVPLIGGFEIVVGLALLWRGRVVRAGHAAGAVFQFGLIFSGPWGIINAALALVHGVAARGQYPTSIPTRVREWRE